MPPWLPGLAKGTILGICGSGIKLGVTRRALKKVQENEKAKMDKALLNCYYGRHVLNILILVVAYFLFAGDTSSLIGTALGLTFPEFIVLIKKVFE